MIEDVIKLGERGQVTIPMSIRKKEKLKAKTLLRVYDVDGLIILKKIDEAPLNIDKTLQTIGNLDLTKEDWQLIEKERETR